jgi:serine/threonine protein phosphatase PrpC
MAEDLIFRVAGSSLPEPGAPLEANSDRFGHVAWTAPDGAAQVALVVADGVSSSPGRQVAAQIAVDTIVQMAPSLASNGNVSEQVERLVLQAHREVQRHQPRGDALCALVAARIDLATGQACVALAGDCSALVLRQGSLTRLTEDQVGHIPVRLSGTPLLSGGAVVTGRGLLQAVGQVGSLMPTLTRCTLAAGDMLILASDGAGTVEMEPRLAGLLTENGPWLTDRGVERCCTVLREVSDDDTTVLVLSLDSGADVRALRTGCDAYATLPVPGREELLTRMEAARYGELPALLRCFRAEDDERRSLRLLALAAAHADDEPRERWIERLDGATAHGQRTLCDELMGIIRRLPG